MSSVACLEGAIAHHSAAAYDVSAVFRIEGAVTAFNWGNPHIYIELEEAGSDPDQPRHWLVELAHPGTVSRFGLDRESLKTGDVISVLANAPRNLDRSIASLVTLEMAGETLVDMRDIVQVFQPMISELGSAAAESIEGVWAPPQDALQQVGLADVAPLNLTDSGLEAMRGFDPRSIATECEPDPIPSGMLSANSPTFLSIEVESDAVIIRREAESMIRVIRLDRDSHTNEQLLPYGDSIGWWEGDTLVVDTIGFEPHPQGIAPGVPSGERKHVVERFELSPNRTSLIYGFELEDPDYLVGSISATVEWLHWPRAELAPVPCTVENARRFLAE